MSSDQPLENNEQVPASRRYRYALETLYRAWHRSYPDAKIDTRPARNQFLAIPGALEWALQMYSTSSVHRLETRVHYLKVARLVAIELGIPIDDPRLVSILEKTAELRKDAQTEENKNQFDVTDARFVPLSKIVEIYKLQDKRAQQPMGEYYYYGSGQPVKRQKTSTQYQEHQRRLLLSMYMYHPVIRDDYGTVHMHPDDPVDAMNYLYIRGNDHVIHIGTDKVSRIMGSHEFVVHPTVVKFIQEIQSLTPSTPRRFLLTPVDNLEAPLAPVVSTVGGARKSSGAFRLLASIHGDNGVPARLTVGTLRVAAATAFLSKPHSEQEVEEFARQMRTSKTILRRYYQKLSQGIDVDQERMLIDFL